MSTPSRSSTSFKLKILRPMPCQALFAALLALSIQSSLSFAFDRKVLAGNSFGRWAQRRVTGVSVQTRQQASPTDFQPMIFRREEEEQKSFDRSGGRNLMFYSAAHPTDQICYDAIYSKDPDAPNVIVLPYLYSPKNQGLNAQVESWCRREGYTYVCADYHGVSKSGGFAEDGTISRWTDDTIAMLETVVQGKTIIVGAAVGAWVMMRVAMKRPDLVAGLVGISCDADFTEELLWAELSDEDKAAIMEKGQHEIKWGDTTYAITRNLIEDGRENLILNGALIPIYCPVRLIHGTADVEVPLSTSMRVMEAMESDDVDVVCIKGMTHFIDREKEYKVLNNVMRAVVDAADLYEVDLTSPGSG